MQNKNELKKTSKNLIKFKLRSIEIKKNGFGIKFFRYYTFGWLRIKFNYAFRVIIICCRVLTIEYGMPEFNIQHFSAIYVLEIIGV